MFAKRDRKYRPCVVLAQAGEGPTATRLRRLGWDTYQASEGPEARRLTRMLEPDLVVIDLMLGEESGWLTCAKLAQEWPGGRIVLLGSANESEKSMAHFVGASALVQCDDTLAALVAHSERPRAA